MRNIALKVNGVTTTDFKGAITKADELIRNARFQTQPYLELYGEHQGTHESYDSIEELLSDLSMSKLAQLIKLVEAANGIDPAADFGDITLAKIRQIQSGEKILQKYECEYDFFDEAGDDEERRKKIPCIEDPYFDDIVRHYPPRLISSDKPLVFLYNNKISVQCSEVRLGRSKKIGKYTAGYKVLATALGINEAEVEKERKVLQEANKGVRINMFDGERAKSFCEKMDSAEQFHTYLSSVISNPDAMQLMV